MEGFRLCLLMLLFVGVVWEGNPLCGTEAIRLLRAIVKARGCVLAIVRGC